MKRNIVKKIKRKFKRALRLYSVAVISTLLGALFYHFTSLDTKPKNANEFIKILEKKGYCDNIRCIDNSILEEEIVRRTRLKQKEAQEKQIEAREKVNEALEEERSAKKEAIELGKRLVPTTSDIRTTSTLQPKALIEKKIEETFSKYGEDVVYTFIAIAKAESSMLPNQFNAELHTRYDGSTCTGSYGLFQIACLHVDEPTQLFDLDFNIKIAEKVYLEKGLGDWGVYSSGKYITFLNN